MTTQASNHLGKLLLASAFAATLLVPAGRSAVHAESAAPVEVPAALAAPIATPAVPVSVASATYGAIPIASPISAAVAAQGHEISAAEYAAFLQDKFGIALAGSAYLLAQSEQLTGGAVTDLEELQPLLTRILVELIEGR